MQYLGGKSRIAKPIADIIVAARGDRTFYVGEILRDALIMRADYRDVVSSIPLHKAVIYADPPYAGTTAYGNVESFDSAEFWREMKACVKAGAIVFVSEYAAPKGWREVWGADAISTLRRNNIETSGEIRRAGEKLFVRR